MLCGNRDYVVHFEKKFPYIVNNEYVYIAYLYKYSNNPLYNKMLNDRYYTRSKVCR